ncbi:MAG: hypothetical protein GWO24_31290, partial [Akkermansiaceae bacterium]|nr:hypothetical protein [Akkermansiaceae bacterium]
VTLHGNEVVLNIHGAGVAAHRPSDGRKIWNFPWGNNFPKVAQPHALEGDKVLITASYNQGSHLI